MFKRHVCDVKNSQQVHDLPTTVNNSDFDIFEGFHFRKTVKLFENKTLAKVCEFTVAWFFILVSLPFDTIG